MLFSALAHYPLTTISSFLQLFQGDITPTYRHTGHKSFYRHKLISKYRSDFRAEADWVSSRQQLILQVGESVNHMT